MHCRKFSSNPGTYLGAISTQCMFDNQKCLQGKKLPQLRITHLESYFRSYSFEMYHILSN